MKLISQTSAQKLRGGFYTPPEIAKFILKWGINGSKDFDILEPSCGDGAFLTQIKINGFSYNSITAVEFDEIEAQKAESIQLKNTTVINDDFHLYCNETSKRFDLIVGNPPYIRYQFFNREQQVEAEKIFSNSDLKYSKLTNAWVSFVIGSSQLLKETGRIGFVLPAEILQVSFAKPLRNFLAHFYNKINIISFEKLVFPSIQQEVVLLLCEKNNSKTHLIEHIEVENASALDSLDMNRLKTPQKKIDFKSNKWTFYFLDQKEIDFLEELINGNEFKTIGDFASVEVGITTGDNNFFTVPKSIIDKYNLSKYAFPMVGRSVQVSGPKFTISDWKTNRDSEAKAHFLLFPPMKELKKQKGAREYIKIGELNGINNGYKCGIREEWQIVPSVWVSEALFIRRNNLFPKLIINQAKAYTTDTMHRVSIKKGTNLAAFTSSYYNSLSLAFAEICGRSHGGGVLELMPSEVESILLPYNVLNQDLLSYLDKGFRNKIGIDKILKETNKVILKDRGGLSVSDIKIADSIWKKLSNRRLNRK